MSMNKQIRNVSIFVVLMFLSLFGATTYIQVLQAGELRNDARNQRTTLQNSEVQRGSILVAGQPIAQSVPSGNQYNFERIYSGGDADAAAMYAPVTGYTTINQGSTGLEGRENDALSGVSDAQFIDGIKRLFSGQKPQGASVETTINPKAQQAAWTAMQKAGLKGAVVAIDPKTGAVLAMVSTPSYDPNAYTSTFDDDEIIARDRALEADASRPLVNRAIAGDLYPPGSTFKLVVSASAIEHGTATPDTKLPDLSTYTLPGTSVQVRNASRSTCAGGGEVTVRVALQNSCNIPMAELGAQLGSPALSETAQRFGFGQQFSIPMRVTPSLLPENLTPDRLGLASFGQGDVRATPLQMALVSAGIANGGKVMQPNLVKQVIAPDLQQISGFSPKDYGQAISAATASQMTEMMVNNVRNGVASNAGIRGVEVAGKTGTAENGDNDPYTLWFTGFAPANDPKVAVAVVIEDGGGRGQSSDGDLLASPVAKAVMEAVLNS